MICALAAPPFPADAAPTLKGFKAYELDTSHNPVPSYNRSDFYKVSLVTGHIVVQYTTRTLELKGTHLFFANPRIPYSTLLLSHLEGEAGCLALFVELLRGRVVVFRPVEQWDIARWLPTG